MILDSGKTLENADEVAFGDDVRSESVESLKEETKVDFGRLITAMVTPFDSQQRIDWNQTERLINHLIEEQRSDSLVVAGTTGESPTLSDEEKLELFAFAVRTAGNRAKIIAGTGSYDTAHTVHFTQQAEQKGVHGALLVAPYYSRPSDEGLFRHFRAIAEGTKLPLMLYNIPSRTGVNMSAALQLQLSEIQNIVATKESSGDLDQMTTIITKADPSFRLYSGDDNLTLPVLAIGGYGIVSVASHVIGAQMKKMIEAYLAGKTSEAAVLHGKLNPVFKGLFYCPHRVPNPAPVKHALKLRGYDVGGLRLPLVEVTDDEAVFVERLLADLN